MDRRQALIGAATLAGAGLAAAGSAADPAGAGPVPGAIPIRMDAPVTIDARSNPFRIGDRDYVIVSIGRGTLQLGADSHLTARLKAAVMQYAKVDYWVSAAVFDGAGKLLGAAAKKVAVERVRLRAIPTMFVDLDLDFGISKAYGRAAFVAVSIGDRDVPATP